MFSGYTAWFSTSVPENKKTVWLNNGGRKESFEKADYIFSEDAVSEDTVHVFESEAYLDEHLSVFHPACITACDKHQSMNKVNIGKYFFPPSEIQTFMKKQGRQLGWEGSDDVADYNDQDIFHEDPREIQNRDRWKTATRKQSTDKTLNQNKDPIDNNLSPKPGPSNHKPSKPTDTHNYKEQQVADDHRRSDRHKQSNVSGPKETRRNSKDLEQDDINIGVSTRKKSRMNDRSQNYHDENIEVNDITESENVKKNNERQKQTPNKWKGFDVLNIKDLNKVMGDFVTFQIGVGGCEMINMDEQ